MVVIVLLLLPLSLMAQSGRIQDQHYAVRVPGLTAEDRDAVQRDLQGRTDLKLVYACVPAGVLVFESATGEAKQQARQRAWPMIEATRKTHEELTGGLAEAETACAQARNR